MLQRDTPDDYVLATGRTHSVRDFAQIAGRQLGFDLEWRGAGIDEVAVDCASGRTIVKIDPRRFRVVGIDSNVGRAKKKQAMLGWRCQVDIDQLAASMAAADDKRVCDNDYD